MSLEDPMSDDVRLRDVVDDDLAAFFAYQSDPEAVRLAAVMPREHEDFLAHWAKIRADASVRIRTVLVDGEVAGNVLTFDREGHREVGYWIGKPYWGRGVATRALSAFLHEVTTRPLYGVAAKHNAGSIRVLEKCGFRITGEEKEFSNMDGTVVEGVIMKLA
jgi:RimJ/RimL family protein N-acetyltransferase